MRSSFWIGVLLGVFVLGAALPSWHRPTPAAAQAPQQRVWLPLVRGGGVPKPGAPQIISFYADRLSTAASGAVTLRWRVQGATQVSLAPGGALADAGELIVKPQATTTYTLRATNSAGSVARTLAVAVVAPNSPASAALIRQALADGTLSAEQALAYRVYALFGDDRLPLAFRGGLAESAGDEDAVTDMLAAYQALPAELKAALAPFAVPPYHRGSWWDLRTNGMPAAPLAPEAAAAPTAEREEFPCEGPTRMDGSIVGDWDYLDAPNVPVRFWWLRARPQDRQMADRLAQKVADIWLRLTALMGRQPVSDQGASRFGCGGGSDALDISIISFSQASGLLGQVVPLYADDEPTPGFMMLNAEPKGADEEMVLVHELMHVFQAAFRSAPGRAKASWWREATATWAEHYYETTTAAPDRNYEHLFARPRLEELKEPLDTVGGPGAPQYGAYIFPLAVQFLTSSSSLVRVSFEEMERNTSVLGAINKVLPGGFARQWPQAARMFWNRGPVDDFRRQDNLIHGAKPLISTTITLANSPAQHVPLDAEVNYLSAHYFHFSFEAGNELPRAVLLTHGLAENPNARVRLIFQLSDKSWHEEDVTARGGRTFCRDKLSERLLSMTVIISNHDWQGKRKLAPKLPTQLTATNIGCWQWKGSVSATYASDGFTSLRQSATSSDVLYERVRFPEMPDGSLIQEQLRAVGGTLSWNHRSTAPNCSSVSRKGTFAAAGSEGSDVATFMILQPYAVDPLLRYTPDDRGYAIQGSRLAKITVPMACGGTSWLAVGLNWLVAPSEDAKFQYQVSADGTRLEGSYIDPTNGASYTWKLTAQRE